MRRPDLNLLATLDALLAERSVTRAARRLRIGQPAASHALSRLRVLFDDPLFVRSGRDMVPTPRALALREPVARLLSDAARLVDGALDFDPRSCTRTFALGCPDLLATGIPKIADELRRRAPRATLEVRPRPPAAALSLERGECDVVLAPTPDEGPGLMCHGLGKLRFGVLARRGHPALKEKKRLTAKSWAAHPHVLVRTGHHGRSIVGEHLADVGFERQIGLVVPTFLTAMIAVSQTDFFFTVPRQLVRALAPRLRLAVVDPPIPLPRAHVSAVWHERFGADPAHTFFRQLIARQVASLLNPPAA